MSHTTLNTNNAVEVTLNEVTNLYYASSVSRPGTVAVSSVKEDAIEILERYLSDFS